jgi:hypothetical protein
MTDIVSMAIKNHQLLQFYYDGGIRAVEPHCYGLTTKGNEGLRAFQVSGYSSTTTLGWKMFDLSKATSIIILDQTFVNPRVGYKRGDKGMKTIFSEI